MTFKLFIFFITIFNTLICLASDRKIHINSDELSLIKDDNSAIYQGNVVVTFDNITIFTEKIIIQYSKRSTSHKKSDIEQIIFPKEIKYINFCSDEVALANSGAFNKLTRKMVLSGNVKIKKGDYILYTDKMVVVAKLKNIENRVHGS